MAQAKKQSTDLGDRLSTRTRQVAALAGIIDTATRTRSFDGAQLQDALSLLESLAQEAHAAALEVLRVADRPTPKPTAPRAEPKKRGRKPKVLQTVPAIVGNGAVQ